MPHVFTVVPKVLQRCHSQFQWYQWRYTVANDTTEVLKPFPVVSTYYRGVNVLSSGINSRSSGVKCVLSMLLQ